MSRLTAIEAAAQIRYHVNEASKHQDRVVMLGTKKSTPENQRLMSEAVQARNYHDARVVVLRAAGAMALDGVRV